MTFKNPYTQFVLDSANVLRNPYELLFDKNINLPAVNVKGANQLNVTWGPWEFRCVAEEKAIYYVLYNEAAMYEIVLNEVNDTAEILDWIIHISSKNEFSYGLGCTYFIGRAFKDILAHSNINIRSNAIFDGAKVAGKYWQGLRIKRNMSVRLRHTILERDNFKCCDCGASVATGAVLEVDHTIPISKGGSNDPSNLRTLCADCNRGKAARIVKYI
jgi:hypothetical protein